MNIEPVRILLVEDNPADARLVKEMLKDAATGGLTSFEYDIIHAARLSEALKYLGSEGFSVMLVDLDLPDSRGIETFLAVHKAAPSVPVVLLTGLADEAMGVKAVKEGAQDYLVKGQVDENALVRAIKYALERHRAIVERHAPAPQTNGQKAASGERPPFDIIGSAPKFKEVMALIGTVTKTSTTSVLITGETGTGKELAANSIHYLSNRREGPFIKVNCSAIPDALLEAEMFGYEKGAFTDAKQSKKGLFELAHGGSIFLDEIGDMDLRLQPKLLQVLENRVFRKVGGTKDIHVDVRVITATNKDLDAMVKEKRFREDLFYRLKVMVIELPPLRERKEDIIPIAEHFLSENCRASGANKTISKECYAVLAEYPWPGNIRELKNTIERAAILAHDSDEICPRHLPLDIAGASIGVMPELGATQTDITLDEMERRYIRHILAKTNGNKTKAAEILGISRLTLREKLKTPQ
ncbi:sigma-54-dependent Fis family transcriptional regulator [bacterium]|nr:MAG: sigma-54-dependent Fis family transcriptional regulator [bacterium]